MSSTSLQQFTLFNRLPAELRLGIWRHSCHARVVEVRYSAERDQCLTTTKPPAVLHACSESRAEGLRSYVRAFGTQTHSAAIWFAPAMDVLYIPRWEDTGYADTARDFAQYVHHTTEHVGSLAIDHVKPEIRRPWETYSKFCLMRNFPHLRETFLVLSDDGRGDQQGQIEFVDPRGGADAIMALMENVRASFAHEIGAECFGWDDEAIGTTSYGHGLDLIPKSKAYGWGESSRATVACG